MNPICFYHNRDLDGVCSAAIVKNFVPECELYGIDYGDEFPWDRADTGKRTVYMVDFSLPAEDMKRLAEVSDLIWIDHHKTAIDGAIACGTIEFSGGIWITDYAACELCWQWFMSVQKKLSFEMPEAVTLLGVYDSWRSDDPDWDSEVMPFQYGMRFQDWAYDPLSCYWTCLFSHAGESSAIVHRTIAMGLVCLGYQQQQNEKIAKSGAFDVSLWAGDARWHAIAINTPIANSSAFDSVWDPELYDVMMPFAYQNNGKWRVSLYTTRDDINCGEIAKAFGGGGHAKAAGFVCDELPWRERE